MWMLILVLSAFAADPVETDVPVLEVPPTTAPEVPEDVTPPVETPEPEVKVPLPEVKVPATDAEAIDAAEKGLNAFQAGQYGLLGALVLGLLVFLYNRFFGKPLTPPPSV